LAFLNILCKAFSASPSHWENISGLLTGRKLTLLAPATALAARVFPVPGGPERRIPLGALTPN